MSPYIFTSERLGFRQWLDDDFEAFYIMCKDPEVMEFFPKTLDQVEVSQLIQKFKKPIEKSGIGFFAVDRLSTQSFIGFIGAKHQDMDADFTPCVEIGWRLDKTVWGNGYATEGAKATLNYVFDKGIANEVYAFTPIQNRKSERVMQKIGMQHKLFFDHPLLDSDSPLLSHTLYQIEKSDFNKMH